MLFSLIAKGKSFLYDCDPQARLVRELIKTAGLHRNAGTIESIGLCCTAKLL